VLVCTILVCMMLIGFLWLECGLVRKAEALVRAHGGAFFLKSEPGQGLEVFVRFPPTRAVTPDLALRAS
jgi:hypothetical protein